MTIHQGTAGAVLAVLQSYGLKKEPSGRFRSNSPLRPGSNSHALSLLIDDDEHGCYSDFVSGEQGSLYQLAERLGIERPRNDQAGDEKPYRGTYRDMAAYAEAHYTPLKAFEQAGWQMTREGGRPALAFTTPTGTRYRYLDDQSPRYRSPRGYARSWYRLPEAVALAGDGPLVICNGEASTVAAQWHGVAATCITGGEKASLPDDLVAELRNHWTGPVLVAFDADATGRRAGPQLAAQLQAAGIDAQAIDLMPGISDGFDLADFCGLHQAQSAAALSQLSPVSGSAERATRPRLVHASRLHEAVEKITWLIPGVIGLNSISQMFGAPGSGKSLLALDQALCVAQVAPVIYIAGEAAGEQEERIAAWCRHHNRDVGELYFWPEPVTLKDAASVDQFISEAMTVQPAMIVLDPLASCMVGLEESSTGDMTIAVDALNRIRKATGAAINVVHHTGWNETHERGNSALRGACRVVIKLSSDDTGLMTLTSEKANNGKPFDARYFRLIDAANSVVPVPASKVDTRGAPLTVKHIEILESLELQQHSDGATFTNILDYTGQGKSTLHKGINRLLERGLIARERQIYSLTGAGRAKLEAANSATEFASSPGSSPGELGVNWAVNWERTNSELAHQDAEFTEFTEFTADPTVVHPVSLAAGENQFTVNSVSESDSSPQFTASSPISSPSEFTSSPLSRSLERERGELANSEPGELTSVIPGGELFEPEPPARQSTSPRLALIAELERYGGELPRDSQTIEELQALVDAHRRRLATASTCIADRLRTSKGVT